MVAIAEPLGTSNVAAQSASPPHIVVLIADDLGYGELGCQGNSEISTPHIDSIATAGVRFTNGYVAASYCSQSRAGLMTGRFPSRFGYDYNPIGAENEDPRLGIPPNELTLAEQLRHAGYATGLIGKWHLGGTAAYHPQRHGFEEFFGFLHEGHFYKRPPYAGLVSMLRRRALPPESEDRWVSSGQRLILSAHMGHDEPPYDANNPVLRDGQPVVEEAYLTDAFTREAVSFIRRHRERPFFLCVAYNAVHSPLQAREEDLERLKHIRDVHRRIFAAMLVRMDDSVGAILAELRAAGRNENTLIVFVSDNGGPTRELTSSNAPLRGGKGSLYEGGIRVPFLMQWNGYLPPGVIFEDPISTVDLLPTLAAAAGRPVARGVPMDGVDLLPFLTGEVTGRPHDTLFWRMNDKAALRDGDWKLVGESDGRDGPAWKIFHLGDDPAEVSDLAAVHPQKVEELSNKWRQLDQEMPRPIRKRP